MPTPDRVSMLKTYRADLHIHTCLSPCADWGMSPRKIVRRSAQAGIDIIAVCDHNSAENAAAVMCAGREVGIFVLPGMEICTREEVHLLSIFGNTARAEEMQEEVYRHLEGDNQPSVWGYQVVANERDEVLRENERLLIGASRLSVYDAVRKIHEKGGLAIASHVDRPAFGIIGQLGFIPQDLPLDGIEVSRRTTPEEARNRYPEIRAFACITSSDAHYLNDIGSASTGLLMAEPTFAELQRALKNEGGRKVV